MTSYVNIIDSLAGTNPQQFLRGTGIQVSLKARQAEQCLQHWPIGFNRADIQVDELLAGTSNAHTVMWTAPSGGDNWSEVGNADQIDGKDTGTVSSVIDLTLPHTQLLMVGNRYS